MRALGEYFENIPANLLTRERPASSSPQPEIVKLKGKRAVFGSEPEQQQKINTGFVKWITGNDPLKARLLNSNELVEFLPHFKLVLLCNDIPLMDSNDFGIWRRSRIKEFPVTFMDNPRSSNKYEKPLDESLKQTIPECKAEFMLYLMEYFRKYRRMKRLRPTTRVLQMVERHKKRSNNVMQFVDECTTPADGHGILITDLYPRYRQWILSELPGEQPLIKLKVIEELQKLKNVEYTRYCRVQGRRGGGQQGIKGRKFKEFGRREGDDEDGSDSEETLQDGAAMP
jgi:putative DNA primase/helicase